MTRTEKLLAAAGVVAVLWLGDQRALAAFVLLVGAVLWWFDAVFFDEEKCWCDNGKVRSWFTDTWRRHRRCGGTGVRPRRSRRLLNRRNQ